MMYTERLARIARRKERLIGDCAVQRAHLSAELSAWHAPLRTVERGIAATRFVRTHPVAVAALVATGAVLGRRHVLRWAARGIVIWRGWRSVQTLVGMLRGLSP